MAMNFTSKPPVALVTGGRQGIGRAAALALARQGFHLVIADLHDDQRTQVTLADIRALGVRADFMRTDIADLATHAGLVEAVWSLHGHVDCLVDNAGVAARPLRDVLDITPEDFDGNFDVNIRGTFFLTQAVARRMLEDRAPRHYRSVIVISSMAAHYARLNRSQYCMSKAAVAMMAKILALRLAPHGIHVHDIRPGFIRTEMTGSLDTSAQDARIASGEVPLRRWGEAADVGQLVATLAAGLVPYVTGEPFVIDGGLRANSA
jgi:NAD(P)-dependent dehydrogenase (short-subunit alcohol dehydrogenase family)